MLWLSLLQLLLLLLCKYNILLLLIAIATTTAANATVEACTIFYMLDVNSKLSSKGK